MKRLLQLIKDSEDVRAFFECLNMEGLIFHPDNDFADYVSLETGKPTYTKAQVKMRNAMLDRCFEVCTREKVDIHGLAIEVFYPEMAKAAAEAA